MTKPRRTVKTGKQLLDLQNFLPYRMLIATDQVTRLFEIRYAAEFGVSIPESRILNVLSCFAPLSSRDICEMTAMTKPRVSGALARLTATGLVRRAVDETDKRLLHLELTTRGYALHQKIVPAAREMERRLTEELDEDERTALMTMLRKIEERARQEVRKLRRQRAEPEDDEDDRLVGTTAAE